MLDQVTSKIAIKIIFRYLFYSKLYHTYLKLAVLSWNFIASILAYAHMLYAISQNLLFLLFIKKKNL